MKNTIKENPNVLVLLATYNGEKYLVPQIDSILAQKEVDISILIADDCSQDKTLEIIQKHYGLEERISFYVNKNNLGYSKNYMTLMKNVSLYKYDYICLSDQDDVWLDNKVISGINMIRREKDNIPVLYSSNLTAVNAKLKTIKTMYHNDIITDNALESYCTGCTIIFNNPALALIKEYPMDKVDLPHDYIIKNIALTCGKYIYDSNSYIQYRQHSHNQIGVNDTHKFEKRVRKFFKPSDHHYSNLYKNIREVYGLALLKQYDGVTFTMANYRNKLSCYLRLLFTNKYRKNTFSDNFAFKIAILFKKY